MWRNVNQTFRTIHFYDWMTYDSNAFDPLSTTPADWGLSDQKVYIGESPDYAVHTLKYGDVFVN